MGIDRVKEPQGNFECAMLVNDLRKFEEVDVNSFYVVLFTKNADSDPCRILKFKRVMMRQSSKVTKRAMLQPW